MHHQQQFSCINSRQRYFTILTPPRRSSVMYTHREYICCHRILPKWMLYWLCVENGTYSQLLISTLCHHLLWTSTTTWGSCAVQWTHQKIKDRFGHPFFFIGSPTHRKLLLKNKKSFALVNGSPEAKLHVDSWGQNLAKIWTHVLLAIQRGGKEDILNKREEHFCYGSSESPPAKHGSGELMWQRVTSRGL